MSGSIKLPSDDKNHAYASVAPGENSPPVYVAHPVGSNADISDDDDDDDSTGDLEDARFDGFELDEERRDFELGLFSCFGHGSLCLLASFVGPCLFARTNRLMTRNASEDPKALQSQFGSFVNRISLGYLGIGIVTHGIGSSCWHTVRRGNLRAKYNIKGHVVKDCLVSFACAPCSLAQEDYEVRQQEAEKMRREYRFAQEEHSEYLI